MRFGIDTTAEISRLIGKGLKTRHTVPARSENPPRLMDGEVYPVLVPRRDDRPGRRRRVAPSHPTCWVLVLGKSRASLADIAADPLALRAEGFRRSGAWKLWWVETYDRLWVREAENASGFYDPISEHEAVKRFDLFHAPKAAWVIELQLVEPPRLLAQGGGDEGDGYTTVGGLSHEPEAVSETEQLAMSRAAREQWEKDHADELSRRRVRSEMAALRAAERRAVAHGVDITAELAEIRKAREAIEEKTNHAA